MILRSLLAVLALSALASCGGGGGAAPDPTPLARATFAASEAEIANPGRGFYTWAADDLLQWTAADAQAQFAAGYRLVYAVVRLDAWRDAELPASVLDRLAAQLAIARSAGLKLVLRFVYNYPANETEYLGAQDAPLARVQAHLAQLKPVLAAQADVIAHLQAGFAGAWGEWHTSSNALVTPAHRTALRDALLDALPPGQFLQLRYPGHLRAWSTSVPAWRDGSTAGRLGLHNDCFLASATDVGTYSEDSATRQAERSYAAALAQVTPFGGETCNPADEPGAVPRSTCADILAEGRQFALSYLNDDYERTQFHERWQAGGCMAEVRRRIGYRFEWQALQHDARLRAGAAGRLVLDGRNSGWSRAWHAYAPSLWLLPAGGGARVELPLPGVDLRDWAPGADRRVEAGFTVPTGAPPGDYEVALAVPDAAPRLHGDPRYSVRPAIADDPARGQRWDAALGAFRTGTTLTVAP